MASGYCIRWSSFKTGKTEMIFKYILARKYMKQQTKTIKVYRILEDKNPIEIIQEKAMTTAKANNGRVKHLNF